MALEEVLIKKEDGMKYMPELYAVPADKVNLFWCLKHHSFSSSHVKSLRLLWTSEHRDGVTTQNPWELHVLLVAMDVPEPDVVDDRLCDIQSTY